MRTTNAKWDPSLGGTNRLLVAGLTADESKASKAAKAARPMAKRYAATLTRHFAEKRAE